MTGIPVQSPAGGALDALLVGSRQWFEYHCWEHPESQDAPAWYHSHQQVTVTAVHVNDSAGMTRAERDEAGMPRTYTVLFPDGLEWGAFEDELTPTPDTWFRPDPPPSPDSTSRGLGGASL